MDDWDIKIQKIMKAKIHEPEDYEQKILNTIRTTSDEEKSSRFIIMKKVLATVGISLILVSGIVYAINIKSTNKSDRGLGNGVETAIDNGYIEEVDKDFTSINDINANIKMENILMDDTNLSARLIIDFEDEISNQINIDKVYEIELTDLIVRDEENRILHGGSDEERFKTYCIENNLNYTFGQINENYVGSGVQCFIEDKGNNNIRLMYNMIANNFPKSKKLYFSLTKILMKVSEGNSYLINGDWQIEIDVPEEMYNRTEEYYKVKSCDNEDFDVYTAKVTNTGFEIGVIISNIETPRTDMQKLRKYGKVNDDSSNGKISYEEAMEYVNWYANWFDSMHPIATSDHNFKKEKIDASYVQNAEGKTFNCSFSPSRNATTVFLDGNKYDFYETFEMTKYDATDKIKAVLHYYGTPVTIELEKVK